jgi:hypothetical protein
MSSARWSPFCALALALSLVPSLASADETLSAAVKRRVEEALVRPLAEKENERSIFSRARPPPRERRVRVTRATPTRDKSDRAFVPFSVDVRFGKDWHENDIVGCAYIESGALFVKLGEEYRPAAVLLGKTGDPVPGVCAPGKANS